MTKKSVGVSRTTVQPIMKRDENDEGHCGVRHAGHVLVRFAAGSTTIEDSIRRARICAREHVKAFGGRTSNAIPVVLQDGRRWRVA